MEAPPILASRRQHSSWVLAGVLALVVAMVVLFLFDPSRNGFYPRCMLYVTPGLSCPGCGALRAMHSLVHGRVLAALHYNCLLVLSLPFLAVYGLSYLSAMLDGRQAPPLHVRPIPIMILLVVVIVFTILRNIPGMPFTYLAPGP